MLIIVLVISSYFEIEAAFIEVLSNGKHHLICLLRLAMLCGGCWFGM